MSQLQSDKFNIAWFKLAEFVARKEKERAMGIYRLLVHSLPEEALACQLEGDLLLAFNDEKAVHSYSKAANLYEKSGNLIKAAAVYEHCITLIPDSIEHLIKLYQLYIKLNNTDRAQRIFSVITKILCTKKQYQQVIDLVHDENNKINLLQKIICLEIATLEKLSTAPSDVIDQDWINQIIDYYVSSADRKTLNAFLKKIEALDSQAYKYAKTYIKRD